jgi:hypothetical protein
LESFLLNRSVDLTYPAKTAKYELVETIWKRLTDGSISLDDIRSGKELITRIERFINQGAFFKAVEHRVAFESSG